MNLGENIMAIAKNFLKFPQAMAMQWPLPLGKPRWHTSRPTTRLGRAIRAFISRAVKAAAALPHAEKLELARAVKKPAPQWWRDAKRRAQALAKKIKDSCMKLDFYSAKELEPVQDMGGFFVPGSEFDQSIKKPFLTIWRQTASGTCKSVACWL